MRGYTFKKMADNLHAACTYLFPDQKIEAIVEYKTKGREFVVMTYVNEVFYCIFGKDLRELDKKLVEDVAGYKPVFRTSACAKYKEFDNNFNTRYKVLMVTKEAFKEFEEFETSIGIKPVDMTED